MSLQIGRESFSNLHDWMQQQAQQTGKGIADAVRTASKAVQDAMVDSTGQSAESQASEMFKEQFGAMAKDKEQFHAFMKQVYGDNYDAATAEQLRQKALTGDYSFLPPVQFVSREDLAGANGAYSADEGVIYLADDLKNNPELMQSTFVEEAGHHIDTLVNKSDTAGDEGEMFRRIMAGEKLSDAQVAEIRNENDKGTITVDGKEIEVEFWNPIKAIKKAAKAVGDAVSGAAKAVGDAVTGAAKAVGGAVAGAAKAVGGAIVGAAKAVGGAVADAAKTVANGVKDIAVKSFNFMSSIASSAWSGIQKVGEKIADGAKAAWNKIKEVAEPVVDAVKEAGKAVGRGLKEFGEGVFNASKSLFNGLKDMTYGFGKNLIQGNIGEAFRSIVKGADKAIFGTAGALANGVINAGEQMLAAPTYLFGGAGKWIREEVISRGVDVVRQAANTLNEVGRDVFRLVTELPISFGEDMYKAAALAVQGKWGEAAERFGLGFANIGSRVGGAVVDIVARVLQGVADIGQTAIGLAPASRELTPDEIALLKEVYGDSIDYSQVRIKDGGPLGADIHGRARVVGNTIYMPSGFSDKPLFDEQGNLTEAGELLIHESGHIWQSQNGGGDYIHQALYGQELGDGYDFQKAIDEGKSFKELNPEQQAEYIAHALGEILARPGDAEENLRDARDAGELTQEEFEYAMEALELVHAGEGTPEGLW